MRFKDYSVSQVLVGLDRVGIVGLRDALKKASASGLQDRDEIVDFAMGILGSKNYIPASQVDAYRTAVWREYLRHQGEDFSAFYSEVPVTVRGAAGGKRDQFVALVRSVLADLELRPIVAFADDAEGPHEAELQIRDETVARSPQSRRSLEQAVRQSLSAW